MPNWLINKLDSFYWNGPDELTIAQRIVGCILQKYAKDLEWWA